MSAVKITFVPIERIVRDPQHQLRRFPDGGTVDPDIVEQYRLDKLAGDEFPPLKVTSDGEHYWLYDGWHQLAAEEQIPGRGSVPCIVTPGNDRDALFLALSANRNHGQTRTNADKAHAVDVLLANEDLIARARKSAVGTGGLHRALAAAAGVVPDTIINALARRGLRVSGNKFVPLEKPAPEPEPVATATRTRSEPADADDDDRDDDDTDTGEDSETESDEPMYTVPPPRSRAEELADMVQTVRKALVEYAGKAGAPRKNLLNWSPLGAGPLLLVDPILDVLRTSTNTGESRNFTKGAQAQRDALLKQAEALGGPDDTDYPPGVVICPILEQLETKLRAMK